MIYQRFATGICIGLGLWLMPGSVFGATNTLFSTHFEAVENYVANTDLVGQQQWQGQGSGGNGILEAIPNFGQQAYIGFAPPDPADDSLVIWKPINFDPVTTGSPIVKFSVVMNIVDSQATTNRDIFRWSFYNQQVDRLFSIDFDNQYLDVSYLLDGTNDVVFTYIPIVNDSNYTLSVTMDFAANRWSATLNGTLITNNQMITTINAPLNLGDIDAVWLVNQNHGTNAPGDNYMIFDDYRITAETIPVPPARVQLLERTTQGWGLLQVTGQEGSKWALEATTNFVDWTALKTNPISGGSFDYVDTSAAGKSRRFYRARLVP